MINLLDFEIHEIDDYHTTFTLCEKNHKYYLDDVMETHYIELPKFRKMVKKGNIDLSDPKTRLMLILDNQTPNKLFKKVIKMDEYAKQLYKKTEEVLQDKATYLSYIRAEQAKLDEQAQMEYREEKGREKGKKEEKIENAKKMKNKGISLEDIFEITGLDIEFIKKL